MFQIPQYSIEPESDVPVNTDKSSSYYDDYGLIDELKTTYQLTGKEIKIAVLDTGLIRPSSAHFSNIKKAENFTEALPGDWADDHPRQHGTNVCGLIAGNHNIALAPGADLYVAKVIARNGASQLIKPEYIVRGVEWAIANDVDIINLSVAFDTCSREVHQSIKRAFRANKIVIAASGNGAGYASIGSLDYPGAYQESIAVGAITRYNTLFSQNAVGTVMDFVAPGVDLYSITYQSNILQGSSFACAFFSGVIGLYLEGARRVGKPMNSMVQLKRELVKYSIDLGATGFDPKYGYGKIDFKEMFKSLNL